MLFRGYGFQVLVKGIGPFATVLPVAVLFGLAHSQNLNFGPLALLNTVLWGVVLGYAYLRQRRSLAAHRPALRLELGVALARGQSQRVYNGCYRLRDALGTHRKMGGLLSGGAYGPEGGLLTTAVAIGLFFYVAKAPIQQQGPAEEASL